MCLTRITVELRLAFLIGAVALLISSGNLFAAVAAPKISPLSAFSESLSKYKPEDRGAAGEFIMNVLFSRAPTRFYMILEARSEVLSCHGCFAYAALAFESLETSKHSTSRILRKSQMA